MPRLHLPRASLPPDAFVCLSPRSLPSADPFLLPDLPLLPLLLLLLGARALPATWFFAGRLEPHRSLSTPSLCLQLHSHRLVHRPTGTSPPESFSSSLHQPFHCFRIFRSLPTIIQLIPSPWIVALLICSSPALEEEAIGRAQERRAFLFNRPAERDSGYRRCRNSPSAKPDLPGTMFLKSVDLSDTLMTVDVLFEVFDKIIQEVGPQNVVQFIIDNATNYKVAGEMLAARYKTFYWSPCAAHCVNLMLQDLGERDDMKLTVHRCQEITKFICNHAYVLNLMRKFTNGAELIRPAQTWFATDVLTVQGIVKQRNPLRQMFSSDDWAAYPHAYKRKATIVVDTIFNADFSELCELIEDLCTSSESPQIS
ncbi:hypothetical protein EJ110_NYTH38317 [Nymphaea thermarum]|nr:hypothetical protein EJ110_NYTH38317 [Nymphaea thermarum]